MITLNASCMTGGIPDSQALNQVLREFESSLPRLNRLSRYYQGRHDILARGRLPGLPNKRVAHAYPRYIAQVSASYLLGEAVRVDGPEPGASALRELLLHAEADSIDVELALSQAIFGKAVSLCYETGDFSPRVCSLDPRNAFVVYDDTVAHEPLFGVYCSSTSNERKISVYTKDQVLDYPPGKTAAPKATPHPFLFLPMNEYLNGKDAHGDFEDVLALIDAYDLLQADRLNDRAQFSDALLILTGVMGFGMEGMDGQDVLERLRQEKTLALPDSEAKAEWLVKTPLEKDIDILRAALSQDIHKFSLTPDFSDEHFAGNASGIAIKYKLFNFDNRIKLKERYFITGLRERARALCGWLASRQQVHLDADLLFFKLVRRLPVNELERAQTLKTLENVLPREALALHSPLQAEPASGCWHDNNNERITL